MFSSYAQISDNRYREIYGLDFEEFAVGQIFHHRPGVTISQQDNSDEALDSGNWAMLHYDENYAGNSQFKNCLGVSTLTLQRIFGMSWKTFARKDRITIFEDIAMTAPVFGGDTLYSESEVLEIHAVDGDCGELSVETRGIRPDGTVVTKVRYRIRIYLRGKHPYFDTFAPSQIPRDQRFSAYRQDGTVYVEQSGLFFEELMVGETFEHWPSKSVSLDEAREHSMRSMDWSPRHNDAEYAATNFSDTLPPLTEIHSTIGATTSTTRTLGRVVANLGWKDMKLARYIYPGERIRSETTILNKRESQSRADQGIVTVETRGYDDDEQKVLSFVRTLLVYRAGHGPYLSAGY